MSLGTSRLWLLEDQCDAFWFTLKWRNCKRCILKNGTSWHAYTSFLHPRFKTSEGQKHSSSYLSWRNRSCNTSISWISNVVQNSIWWEDHCFIYYFMSVISFLEIYSNKFLYWTATCLLTGSTFFSAAQHPPTLFCPFIQSLYSFTRLLQIRRGKILRIFKVSLFL